MFVGTPGYSYMTGQFTPTVSGGTSPGAEAYANFAVGFASAYGYASSSADQASIYSGSTATVAMTPGYSYLSNTAGSSTNSSFADGFGNTYAYADGGDSAFLYDAATVAGSTSPASASGVSFVNNPAYSYMSGAFMPGGLSEFFNETEGFAAIYAEAEGSGDIAYLQATGSSGTPELAFANGAAGIKDSSGEAVAVGFQLAFATGTSTPGTSSSSTSSASGTNIPAATSPPSSGSGTIVVAGNQANAPMVTPDGSEVAYSNGPALDASGFGNVNVDDDDDSMAATDFVFNQLGNWTG
jgi:hypothetical protein